MAKEQRELLIQNLLQQNILLAALSCEVMVALLF